VTSVDKPFKQWIYLSPHLDDIALSCGGLAWEQARAGESVAVWTICAGDPPSSQLTPLAQELHARWEAGRAAVALRREEDTRSCEALGVKLRHFPYPDVIYRTCPESGLPVINHNEELFTVQPEPALLAELALLLQREIPAGSQVVCPMCVGQHVDHLLVRAAAERTGMPLLYYADYPYVLASPEMLAILEGREWKRQAAPISEPGLLAWQAAITAHHSQISTFWKDDREMALALRNYWAGGGGRLWAAR
jgi:LmbE family N-acetylglucosaminyl deacetylase